MRTLNEVYSTLSVRRRYEVWFLRLDLADGSGAWWFRYLLMNPGRRGCSEAQHGMPVQVWATWFLKDGTPQTFIKGFPLGDLDLSRRGEHPFHLRVGNEAIEETSCRGALHVDGHAISWDLQYRSTFRTTLSNKGWIGFSRTPHSDARFSGQITLDGRTFHGDPLGFGLQGHNCGYRHRSFWVWTHAHFRSGDHSSTLEALIYDMPLGLVFRKVILWHKGKQHVFRSLREIQRDRENLQWEFRCTGGKGLQLDVAIDGRGLGIHRLPYQKTDCSGSFDVVNNSLAKAVVRITRPGGAVEELVTLVGAVLEMGG